MCLTLEDTTIGIQVLLDLKRDLCAMTGVPVIQPLTEKHYRAEQRIRKLAAVYGKKNVKPGFRHFYRKYSSTWGLLTRMILRGRNAGATNSVRFGHFEIMEGSVGAGKEEMLTRLKKVFLDSETRFPWLLRNGALSEDFRMRKVRFDQTEIIHLCGMQSNQTQNGNVSEIPMIILSDCGDEAHEQENRIVMREVAKRPFVLFLKSYKYNSRKVTLGHIICNHEFMDGLPAAYYLSLWMRSMGLKQVHAGTFSEEFLKRVLNEADRRECIPGKTEFCPRTCLAGEVWTQNFLRFHHQVNVLLGREGLHVGTEVFAHLFFLSCFISQSNIRGSVLKFSPYADEQLGFYEAGDVISLFNALVFNPEQLKQNHPENTVKNKTIGLFRKGSNVVSECIEPLAARLPVWLTALLNRYAEWTGASRAMIGQIVVTGIPSEIVINGNAINAGLGYGGPACSDIQDAALTFGFVRDETGAVVNTVIRTKFRKLQSSG